MSRSIRTAGPILAAALLVSACTLETTGAVKGDARFTSRFDDAQELVVGHTVRISDVNVGTVLGIELDGYEALVEFTIEDGRHLPKGTTASIQMTSLLGENYVALQLPENPEDAPPLESGATLPSGGSTATVEELAIELLALTRAVQGRDLAAIVETGAVGLGPRGAELNELIGTVGSVTNSFAGQAQVFDALLTDLDGLLSTLASDADDIGQTIELAADATGSLARQRKRLVTVVGDLTALAVTLDAEVLAPHRERLTRIVGDLAPVASLVAGEREWLIRIIDQLVIVTERLPTAIHEGAVIAYAWLDDFNFDGVQLRTTDLGTALGELLLGVQP
ncbi:MCE family protein [Acidimicrobiia bacterium EGI L10123]|uniref:MlaD family protein n=1 Tax=Salinilacustrithrix flava TaxID=2957203 RepID=UPI003D7C327B|nr:MCE family protein [Acidimicrobiia bacterium EGI L10123]